MLGREWFRSECGLWSAFAVPLGFRFHWFFVASGVPMRGLWWLWWWRGSGVECSGGVRKKGRGCFSPGGSFTSLLLVLVLVLVLCPFSGTNARQRKESAFGSGVGLDVTDDLESRGNGNRRPKHHSDFSYCPTQDAFPRPQGARRGRVLAVWRFLSSSLLPSLSTLHPSTFPSPPTLLLFPLSPQHFPVLTREDYTNRRPPQLTPLPQRPALDPRERHVGSGVDARGSGERAAGGRLC